MARELTGSEQARRAGLWDEVRPQALVPRERDPVTGSLKDLTDPEGGVKDRRTENSRTEVASSVSPAPRVPKGRWPAVAAAGAVALVLGVGGAVALANRDSDGTASDPGTTGAAGPGATATTGGGPASTSPTPTGPVGPQDRSYEGTMTSTVPGSGSSTFPIRVGVSCTDTECTLLGWSPSGRRIRWAPGETVVTQTLPQIGVVTNMCEGKESFSPEGTWVMTVTDDALSFTATFPEETAQCGGGSSVGTSGIAYAFDGTRTT